MKKNLVMSAWCCCLLYLSSMGTSSLLAQDKASNGNEAIVKDHNLYVRTATTTKAVSSDGSLDITYGESVHRDEFGIDKGTFWSPTGKLLAFYRMDQSMVTTYPQVDVSPQQTRIAQMIPDKYPMAGEKSHQVKIGIYNTLTEKITYLNTGDPTDRYFTNIAWSPDEKNIYLIEVNREQNHAHLDRYNVTTGEQEAVLVEERQEKYVEPMHPIQFLPWDETKFILQSRRDGWNHIYLYDQSGKCLRQLTKGEWEVFDVIGFNTETKQILYTSNETHTIGCNIYQTNEKGKRKLLGNKDGWHHPTLSEDGNTIFDTWTSPSVWFEKDEINVVTGEVKEGKEERGVREVRGGKLDIKVETGTLKAADGKTDLYYRLILPKDFDPTKKYPAVVYVYGGPHFHNVSLSRLYGARELEIKMANRGYVMFCLDNRGSEHRGRDFEQATFRQLGVEEMKDQLVGVDYLKSLPFVDAERLGVHGWSFGGFMTTSLMTTYPDVFKVGVAGGPVIDWKYYEVMYGERYMDTPQTNPEGYEKTSLLNKAGDLKGRLLIIYGGNDPTCVPQHSLSFIRACIDKGTHPDLFIYPGDGHNMGGKDRIHLEDHIMRYFDDYLK